MNKDQNTAILKQTFDAVSAGYDSKNLRFFSRSANVLCSTLDLHGCEHILDVATGTGHTALALAGCLPNGRVTGVDISSGMLKRAREKASQMQCGNVEFIERDMRDLGFGDDYFDLAVCSFGIFFVEDIEAQLAHIMSVVKSGGRIAVTSFELNYFEPLKSLMYERFLTVYAGKESPQTWKRLATEAKCRKLFEGANLKDVQVRQENVGYYLDTPEDWWDVIWNAGFRRLVSQLQAEDIERFKRDHLQEVEAHKSADGIWLDAPVLCTIGTKP